MLLHEPITHGRSDQAPDVQLGDSRTVDSSGSALRYIPIPVSSLRNMRFGSLLVLSVLASAAHGFQSPASLTNPRGSIVRLSMATADEESGPVLNKYSRQVTWERPA